MSFQAAELKRAVVGTAMYRSFPGKVKCGFAFVSLSVTLSAQSNHADQIRAAMEKSLRTQQASVALQVRLQSKQVGRTSGKVVSPVRAFQVPLMTRSTCGPIPTDVLIPQIQQVAAEQGLVPELLSAVAHAESGFLPCAVSPKGAAGLMQIMPATGHDLGLIDPWDPQQSLAAGAKYLRQLLDRYDGDVRRALGAYNAGPGRVDQYGDVPPLEETQNYVRKILAEFTANTRLVAVPE